MKKEQKRTKKINVNKRDSSQAFGGSEEVKRLMQIIAVLVVIFVIFYGITLLVTKKDENYTPEKEEVEIQYQEILASQILNQSSDSYYVMITFEEDAYLPLYDNYFDIYAQKESTIKKYNVNINNGFNINYISDVSNLETNIVHELKFKHSTLLKIKNQAIVSYFEGKEEIINYLNSVIDR